MFIIFTSEYLQTNAGHVCTIPPLNSFLIGLYGHSSVYHAPGQSIYVHAGYTYMSDKGGAVVSNALYVLDLSRRENNPTNLSWSVLPHDPDNKVSFVACI